MRIEELNKLRIKCPLPFPIQEHTESDEHGTYSTGVYNYKGKTIIVAIEGGLWHISISTKHPIGYYELKQVRYEFCPNRLSMAQIFPPREEFVNVHENCYHLWEVRE